MSPPNFGNSELAEDYQNILSTLEKIKSVEEMSLSGGDFRRSKLEVRSEQLIEKYDNKAAKGLKVYWYILQFFQIIVGWILERSKIILSLLCGFTEQIMAESFYEITYGLQSQNFQTATREFIKKFDILKALHLVSIIILPPIYAVLKVLLIINKFLLSEIPFE